jgi:branched-chain amino acid transport system substrate-binding protein
VIKIGLVAPFEGRYRTLGYEALYAVKWAVRQRNERGGVAGTMVELVALNDGADPASSAFQARVLAVDPDVVGAIGPFTEATVEAAAPSFRELGLATITPAMCPLSLSADGSESVFCLGASAVDLATTLEARIPAGARVTLLRQCDGDLGELLSLVAQQVREGPFHESRFPEVTEGPTDLYLYDGDVLIAAEVLRWLRARGIETPFWGGPDLARIQLSAIAAEGVRGACHAVTLPFLANLAPESAFGVGYRELAGVPPGPWAALAYDATEVLLDALEREIVAEGGASRDGIRRQLRGVDGPGGGPLFGPWGRRGAEIVLYCYGRDDGYPGRPTDP